MNILKELGGQNDPDYLHFSLVKDKLEQYKPSWYISLDFIYLPQTIIFYLDWCTLETERTTLKKRNNMATDREA